MRPWRGRGRNAPAAEGASWETAVVAVAAVVLRSQWERTSL
jgi:hypothetical protein